MKNFIGNQHIIDLFKKLKREDLNHAYLFSGKKGVGKFTFVKNLVKSLQCQNRETLNPCDSCASCKQIENNCHVNTIILENPEKISIKQIREIQKKINLKSKDDQLKFCIIDNAEQLTIEAANSLLKTLEEPPTNSIFILITQTQENLPSTIISRCQKIKFKPVPKKEMEEKITETFPEKEINSEMINHADGAPGKLITLLTNQEIKDDRQQQNDLLNNFINSSIAQRFQINNQLSKKSWHEIKDILELWLSIINSKLRNQDISKTDKGNLLITTKALLEIKRKTHYNLNKRVTLDQLAIITPKIK